MNAVLGQAVDLEIFFYFLVSLFVFNLVEQRSESYLRFAPVSKYLAADNFVFLLNLSSVYFENIQQDIPDQLHRHAPRTVSLALAWLALAFTSYCHSPSTTYLTFQ